MFRSKNQPYVLSQYEHGRLAGILAAHWGNARFDRPDLEVQAWVAGVALHDWHYGLLDNWPIGSVTETEWLTVTQRGLEMHFDHPVTEIVTKLHLRRLLGGDDSSHLQMVEMIDERIHACLMEMDCSLEPFLWADSITRFCDNVAFDFGFGAARTDPMPLVAKRNSQTETDLIYKFESTSEASHTIRVHPWPFSKPAFTSAVTLFEADSYPNELRPHWITVTIESV